MRIKTLDRIIFLSTDEAETLTIFANHYNTTMREAIKYLLIDGIKHIEQLTDVQRTSTKLPRQTYTLQEIEDARSGLENPN